MWLLRPLPGLWRRAARRIGGAALDLLTPCVCRACGVRLEAPDAAFCAACIAAVPWLGPACPRCAQPLEAAAPFPGAAGSSVGPERDSAPAGCAVCLPRSFRFDRAAAAGLHAGPLRVAILRHKFEGDRGVLPLLREGLTRAAASPAVAAELRQAGAVVPVPLHRWKRWCRGRDPVAELAGELAARIGLPLAPLLRKPRWTPSQVGLPRQARIDNLRGAFQLRRGANVPEVVILFDDVLTTGTTASRCALALKRGGARVVAVVALARS